MEPHRRENGRDGHPYITLGQFLKREALVSTGGEAKAFLLQVLVHVNGQEENRRGRKLRLGDSITVNNKTYVVEHL